VYHGFTVSQESSSETGRKSFFDAFDAGFDGDVQGGLVGERTGAVFLGFEEFQLGEGTEQGQDGGTVEPELGLEKTWAPMKTLG
jgi:hypothetical protein